MVALALLPRAGPSQSFRALAFGVDTNQLGQRVCVDGGAGAAASGGQSQSSWASARTPARATDLCRYATQGLQVLGELTLSTGVATAGPRGDVNLASRAPASGSGGRVATSAGSGEGSRGTLRVTTSSG